MEPYLLTKKNQLTGTLLINEATYLFFIFKQREVSKGEQKHLFVYIL